MIHANIIPSPGNGDLNQYVEAGTAAGQRVYLAQGQYTQDELKEFDAEKAKWIIRRSGTRYFLADSDSGEDAEGSYCGYFDLKPANAVFDGGRLVGYYLCPGDLRYSGLSRSSFDVDDWGYPGYDAFMLSGALEKEVHVFLFADPETYKWQDWSLLVREAGKEYKSYIDF